MERNASPTEIYTEQPQQASQTVVSLMTRAGYRFDTERTQGDDRDRLHFVRGVNGSRYSRFHLTVNLANSLFKVHVDLKGHSPNSKSRDLPAELIRLQQHLEAAHAIRRFAPISEQILNILQPANHFDSRLFRDRVKVRNRRKIRHFNAGWKDYREP